MTLCSSAAFASGSYGTAVNTYCSNNGGTTPYNGCALCHTTAPSLNTDGSAYLSANRDPSYFCPTTVDLCAGVIQGPNECGVGACGSSGEVTCDPLTGIIVDTCTPGTPTTESCGNGIDENCNGMADDICPDPTPTIPCDGFVSESTACGVGACGSVGETTCDLVTGDLGDTCVPGAITEEICGDGIDQDCNGADLGCAPTPEVDSDNDGFTEATDCDDSDPSINPDAVEIVGNGIDENCNGMADDVPPITGDCTDPEFMVIRAVYSPAKGKLSVRGGAGISTGITVTDIGDGTVLADQLVEAGVWRVTATDFAATPVRILVTSDTGCTAEADVRIRNRKAEREDDESQSGETAGPHPLGWDHQHGDAVDTNGVSDCLGCHSIDPADKGQATSCYRCHGQKWNADDAEAGDTEQPEGEVPATHEFGWTDPVEQHPDQVESIGVDICEMCHSTDPAVESQAPNCFSCHEEDQWSEEVTTPDVEEPEVETPEVETPEVGEPPIEDTAGHPFGWDNPRRSHDGYVERNGVGECLPCHFTSSDSRGDWMSCYRCHEREW